MRDEMGSRHRERQRLMKVLHHVNPDNGTHLRSLAMKDYDSAV